MTIIRRAIGMAAGGLLLLGTAVWGETDGAAGLSATIHDYPGNGHNHRTVGWEPLASPPPITSAPPPSSGTAGVPCAPTATGTGPANGIYAVFSTTQPDQPIPAWTLLTNGLFDGSGQFSIAIAVAPSVDKLYLRLRVP